MNHLSKETSPYLLQHVRNPVDWYPWNEAALRKAREENKPILLSIGYAACHWCHVMAEESFADADTAMLMNQWFINIKVDREERPDLDKIYQTAHQLLTGRAGGWPLTLFLTPDKQAPFYAGTYFPSAASSGRPDFKTVLTEVAHFYYQRTDAITNITQALTAALTKIAAASSSGAVLTEAPLSAARTELEAGFDFIHGGFGRVPKFPLAMHLEFLLQSAYFSQGQDAGALNMVEHSLTRMAQGGFCDQLGGGFFRYCIDVNWVIPHFEKMLSDNAQLIPLYATLALIKQDDRLKDIALAAVNWVLREMRAPRGGFYTSLNADSEGVEGKYYYWDRHEVRQVLTPLEYSAVDAYFGLNRPPNFEGHWHLFIAEIDESIHAEYLIHAKEKLLAARTGRVHPSCDKKILTGWNALMIKALAQTAMIFSRNDLAECAQTALDFILENLWKNQRLLAVYTAGHAHLPAYLDDYVFLIDALLEFLQIRWRDEYLQWVIALMDTILERFYDAENGGFFYLAHDHEPLIQRPKIFNDETLPSGNGVVVSCLLRLGHLLGNANYLAAAEKTLQAGWEQINNRPSVHDSLLMGLRGYFHAPTAVILRGEPPLLQDWQQEFRRYYLPDHACYAPIGEFHHLPAGLQKPAPPAGGVYAYICRGAVCRVVVTTKAEFIDYLTRHAVLNH